MPLSIDQDLGRFNHKLRKLKEEGLRRYFSNEQLLIPQNNGDSISIPVRKIHIPRFRFHEYDVGGIGQGDSEESDNTNFDDKGHGHEHEEHQLRKLSLEEAVEFLEEYLELPNLQEKFSGAVAPLTRSRYKAIHHIGPESLRHNRRSLKEALKRTLAEGNYNPKNPSVVILPEDRRYKSTKVIKEPISKVAVIYLQDCSETMTDNIKFLQNVGWWTDTWIRNGYSMIDSRYIHYDSDAWEVSRDTFYFVRAGGGTNMRKGLALAEKIARNDYPEDDFNLYLVHLTDGDCRELEFSEKEIKRYEEIAKKRPGEISIAEIYSNPLTNFLIRRSNAIFVCEAGANYGNYGLNGDSYTGNYSGYLQKLMKQNHSLKKKVRVVSHTDEDIVNGQGLKIKETLLNWFKE